MNMNKYFTMADGRQIPAVGYGTWQTPDGETAAQVVCKAIESGYRLIDCAARYYNEQGVGEGIRRSSIAREQLFVTSKVWNTERGYDKTRRAFEKTLADLGLDYLDLYLIHWPAAPHQFANWRELNAETFRAMADLKKEGRIRSIGVSNFYPHHLDALITDTGITPAVNQIEFHPGFMQAEVVNYCREHNILVEGWRPLGKGAVLEHPDMIRIAAKYGVSVARLCIRWVQQNGVLPLPKSVTPSRIEDNIRLDFNIDADDMATINALPLMGYSGENADEIDF